MTQLLFEVKQEDMVGRRRISSNRRGRSYGRPGRRSGDKTLVLCLVGAVVFVFVLVIFVVVGTKSPDPRPQERLAGAGRTNRPVFRRLDPSEEESGSAPAPRAREASEPEEEPAPPAEPEPAEEENPPPVAEPAAPPPELKPPVIKPPLKPVAKPVAAGTNTVFKMLLTGKLGGENLPSDDPRAWSRIGFFLQHEASERHWLEFSDGKVKVIRRPGAKKKNGTGIPEGYPSSASRKNPGHRLVIHATSSFDGDIEFSGVKTGSRYICRLDCSLEKRKGAVFKSIDSFSIREKITPAVVTTDDDGDPVQLRMVFYAALEKLCLELRDKAPFSS
ncbi:MAG: hypothetical protein OSB83_09565 [Planctomycetota bacterium]|nr:hypothetical protein [Planctomycetota bacterium]